MVNIYEKIKRTESLTESDFLDLCSEFIDENFSSDPVDKDDFDSVLQQIKKEQDREEGVLVTLLDLALFVGFESLKAMYDFATKMSPLGQRIFEYVKTTIENNHIHTAYKNPKGYPLVVALLEKDHGWNTRNPQLQSANVNTIKIDYGANFNLVASQFKEQMEASMLKAIDSVKTISKQEEQKLIAPKTDNPARRQSVEEIREKLRKEIDL